MCVIPIVREGGTKNTKLRINEPAIANGNAGPGKLLVDAIIE
jgi:hypothetical protein